MTIVVRRVQLLITDKHIGPLALKDCELDGRCLRTKKAHSFEWAYLVSAKPPSEMHLVELKDAYLGCEVLFDGFRIIN